MKWNEGTEYLYKFEIGQEFVYSPNFRSLDRQEVRVVVYKWEFKKLMVYVGDFESDRW